MLHSFKTIHTERNIKQTTNNIVTHYSDNNANEYNTYIRNVINLPTALHSNF